MWKELLQPLLFARAQVLVYRVCIYEYAIGADSLFIENTVKNRMYL